MEAHAEEWIVIDRARPVNSRTAGRGPFATAAQKCRSRLHSCLPSLCRAGQNIVRFKGISLRLSHCNKRYERSSRTMICLWVGARGAD